MNEYCKAEVGEDCISRANLIKSFLADCECESREEARAVMLNLEDILKFIEEAPNVIPQVPNEDAISREYMLRALNGYGKDWQEDCEIAETIKNAPSVAPTEKMGRWIKVSGYATPGGDPVWECSECGKGRHVYGIEAPSYQRDVSNQQWVTCPNCGVRME